MVEHLVRYMLYEGDSQSKPATPRLIPDAPVKGLRKFFLFKKSVLLKKVVLRPGISLFNTSPSWHPTRMAGPNSPADTIKIVRPCDDR